MRDGLRDPGRRHVIQHLAMGAGGVLVFPLVASAHPIQQQLRDQDAVALADAKAVAADYVPEFLDQHLFDTLDRLAEQIVPGSSKANSAQFIDQLLSATPLDQQRAFLQALGAFEQLAQTRAQAPWARLTEAQQHELLTFASSQASGTPSDTRAGSRPPHVTIRDHFENLKGWIVGAYYSSEPGMRELGWTGNMFFPVLPGCDHADGHG
jgi:hypothetical protein